MNYRSLSVLNYLALVGLFLSAPALSLSAYAGERTSEWVSELEAAESEQRIWPVADRFGAAR